VAFGVTVAEPAKEAGGGAVAPGAFVRGLGRTVEDMKICGVGTATGGADDEGLVAVAASSRVAKAKASAALGKGGVGIEALDFGKMAKNGRGAVGEDIEANAIWVMEPVDDASMSLASKGGWGAKPAGRHEGTAALAGWAFVEFGHDCVQGNGVTHQVALEGNKAEENVTEARGGGCMAARTEGSEVQVVEGGKLVNREFGGKGKEENSLDVL